ncbi:MAG TPA: glutamine--tRNA ligase [Candidatus Acidoferrales bacterium]|nr:glutamine--tRNA ligase [Candidatus Acidoferrales bacterium]
MTESDAPVAADAGPERDDFIREIVKADVAAGRVRAVATRFPPEPNGYLHVGHATSICLNFGVARQFGGVCNLRMDDTNPEKEEQEYEASIVEDVKWLIAGWADDCLGLKPAGATATAIGDDFALPAVHGEAARSRALEPFRASDYFAALHAFAVRLIEKGHAFVCDHTAEEVDRMRGAPGERGIESHWRGRTVAESLELFARMKAGEFPDGARTLRARIDMTSDNVWLRDPVLYRIRHASHHHTGDAWCVYPLYDFAHGLSDYIEGITHSICTMEFVPHRALYDWLLESLELPRPLPHQYEFARRNVTHTVVSKRKLLRLVREGVVTGWDDPRMPTISGMRRRGYPAAALRDFSERIGVGRREMRAELGLLEHCVREQLNRTAARRLAVLRPLRVVLENYPEGRTETFELANNPEDPAAGVRTVPFSRELLIDADDFRESPPPRFFRLSPGTEVRLRGAYLVRCTGVEHGANGEIATIRATYDPETRSGNAPDGRKVKATIHWLSAAHALPAEVRLYETLFAAEDPEDVPEGADFAAAINPRSLEVLPDARVEPALAGAQPGEAVQFERVGYFVPDARDSRPDRLVFGRTVTLRDAWARVERRQGA